VRYELLHGPHLPRPATADIARLDAIVAGQRTHDRAMLAMLANGDDDGGRAQVHAVL
jgi:hypothetical protein